MSDSPPLEELPSLSQDPETASKQYVKLREYARETFQSFLRNLNSQTLKSIEHNFNENDGEMDMSSFLEMCPIVFPKPNYADFPNQEEQQFIVQLAGKMLFEDVDVDQSHGADWMEFVNFVFAVGETIRLQAEEGSATQFDFFESPLAVPYRPSVTKCGFDKLFYWPNHPIDNVVVFEECQSGFHLHKLKTLQRRKRAEGHRSDLLSATFLPEFGCVVTSGNDKLLCFWDSGFNLIKRWKLDKVVGALCWCPDIWALYFTHQSDANLDRSSMNVKLQAWRIREMMAVRVSEKPFEADDNVMFETGHTEAVQQILWLGPSQCLATCSLDTTVRIFDVVKMTRTHIFSGHTKGVTCLEYCPRLQLLLSGGFNNYICMWDVGAGVRYHKLTGHTCSIIAICAVLDTDNEVITCDLHGTVKVWDLRRLACVQSFHATDLQAEKSGELEALEPRAMIPLSRDRILISGRRMVVWDREFSQPQLSADDRIMAIAFSHRKFEIATSVKNGIRIWCALTGNIVAVHKNVTETNITALSLGLGERRCFVGADNGQLQVINFACGASLKALTPHACEVSQIVCVPDKIVTLSTRERLLRIHDDTNPEKAAVLKTVDLSDLEPITCISLDHDEMVCGGCADGEVVWIALSFAKQVAGSGRCTVKHNGSISSVMYFKTVPLVATADSDSTIIFWSVAPLRPYEFFCRLTLNLAPDAENEPGKKVSNAGTIPITSMSFSSDEGFLVVGTEVGSLACIDVSEVVKSAHDQRQEILYKKKHGQAEDITSGKIFESMPKPDDSDAYNHFLDNKWMVKKAHRGSVDQVIFCTELKRPAIVSLGFDVRVCIWEPETGQFLGTLEQGLPEGLVYKRLSPWRFPIDAHEQVREEMEALAKAAEPEEEADDDDAGSSKSSAGSGGGLEQQSNAGSQRRPGSAGSRASAAGSAQGQPGKQASKNTAGSAAEANRQLSKSNSAPNVRQVSGAGSGPTLRKGAGHQSSGRLDKMPNFSGTRSRLLVGPRHRQVKMDADWFAGPLAPDFARKSKCLPVLNSGMMRHEMKQAQRKDLVSAACRLSEALGSLGADKF
eukprot:TRINITY_DN31519_c0_g1_i1.p1 TRINITY_DN31519_c0_g1~~TRINITY_DN31519_c0_g1_i1.p1  ORF type:complete len:1082 (-),score=262.73 TRINITY_DN31519_c0_g1_i1:157-3366(-)